MILVDPVKRYQKGPRGWRLWCHMATDDLSEMGLEELHELGARIGLRREWIHRRSNLPHYDLIPSTRQMALALGAVEVTTRELARRCRRSRRVPEYQANQEQGGTD